MEDLTDEELMRLSAAGDEKAFAILVRRHQNLVYGTITKLMGGASPDAEDVAQQVFIRVYKAAPRYIPSAKFTTWLYTICRNCVFTESKKKNRHRGVDLHSRGEDQEESLFEQLPDKETPHPAEAFLQKEMQEAIEAAIADLPEQQRVALVLRQYEQLDYEEIAKVMNTTVPSVKSTLFRARDTLREALKNYLHKE